MPITSRKSFSRVNGMRLIETAKNTPNGVAIKIPFNGFRLIIRSLTADKKELLSIAFTHVFLKCNLNTQRICFCVADT